MNLYFYKFEVTRVLDGDTVDGIFDLGFKIKFESRLRMDGFDAPETWRPINEAEREAGEAVTQYLQKIIDEHADNIFCESNKLGIYNRSVGILYYKDEEGFVDINQLVQDYILSEGLEKDQFYIV